MNSNLYRGDFERYVADVDEEIAVADVLAKLKEDLQREETELERATLAVRHLRVAIAAIEQAMTNNAASVSAANTRPTRKRGYLARGVIDAVRDGAGTVAAIRIYLSNKGIQTTGNSISNALSRLHAKGAISLDTAQSRWLIRAGQETGSEYEEGPTEGTEGPLQTNGTAGSHPA